METKIYGKLLEVAVREGQVKVYVNHPSLNVGITLTHYEAQELGIQLIECAAKVRAKVRAKVCNPCAGGDTMPSECVKVSPE